jgi:hypothetical protein
VIKIKKKRRVTVHCSMERIAQKDMRSSPLGEKEIKGKEAALK